MSRRCGNKDISDQISAIRKQQKVASDERPATGNQRQANSDRRSAICDEEAKTSRQRSGSRGMPGATPGGLLG